MANKWAKDSTFKIDNASGTLTDLTASTNQAGIEATLALLDDTVLSDGNPGIFPGLAGASVPWNGFVNSTTEPIFGPLIGVRTSITKTAQWGNGLKFYYGEVYCGDVKMSGNAGELQVLSFTATFDGAVTRTSVTQA